MCRIIAGSNIADTTYNLVCVKGAINGAFVGLMFSQKPSCRWVYSVLASAVAIS